MSRHLGSRVSALLDGQLDPVEEERAWDHVHACHQCRDAVEREGWVKTRLAGLRAEPLGGADRLRGSLRSPAATPGLPSYAGGRGRGTVAVLGGGAVGAAFVGVLALGVAPADLPSPDRTLPTDLSRVQPSPTASSGSSPGPVTVMLERVEETLARAGASGR